VIYYVANTDGRAATMIDAVNRGILARLGEAGLALAYPARRVVTA
jgi:small-conductance mechanosensitive channel